VTLDALCRVRRVDDVWIPTRDGTRLSARIWFPEESDREPVPAILEYIPYRKDDATAPRDAALHGALAAHGFACVRVDLRGSGDSEGVLEGEYLQQELDDGVDAIAWFAEQSWCNGRVGMIGKSWGGFNGLQIAALSPPALSCVVSVCSTDDRYRDDVHYTGGCIFAGAALSWATTMLAYTARPPDPSVTGEAWRERWLERLERIRPFGHEWLAHQRRDEFWRHGSVCERPDAIRCPVYMVGGWADPYRGAVLRLLAAAPDTVKGLIGPWAHVYPHQGAPGPAIDFLDLCQRLFARHLRNEGDGLDAEPALRVWLQEPVPPRTGYTERPGRWVGEERWPPPGREPRRLFLTDGGLREAAGPSVELEHAGLLAHGTDGPTWLPWGAPGELASDQRAEDGRSLVFDTVPLPDRVEILGEPVLELEVVPETETGQLVARLCDVAPDGASTLVTFGLLNLCHARGHAEPRPLVPGTPVSVRLPLTAIGYAFPPGHRIRLALGTCYWPWAWPAPGSLRIRTRTGVEAVLELPVREPQPLDERLTALPPPELPPAPEHEQLAPVDVRRTVRREIGSGRLESVSEMSYFGSFRLADGLVYAERGRDSFSVLEGDPLSAEARSGWELEISRGDWQTRLAVESSMHADATAFHLEDRLDAFEGEELVCSRRWTVSVARDLA
jgi:putative CocE/NonD family hydrolase